MSDLSNQHLQELTGLVNARLDEFKMANMPALSPGVVRVAHDVIKKWYQEKEEAWAMQRISDVTITAEMAMKLSEQGYAAAKRDMSTLGAEPAGGSPLGTDPPQNFDVGSPLRGVDNEVSASQASKNGNDKQSVLPDSDFSAAATAGVLAAGDMDGELRYTRMTTDEKAARMREIIGVLQDKAVDGMMPSMAEWETLRPSHLPRSQALVKQYDINWGDLAARAKLQMKKPGPALGAHGAPAKPVPT